MLVLDETSLSLLKMETSGCTKTKIMVIPREIKIRSTCFYMNIGFGKCLLCAKIKM